MKYIYFYSTVIGDIHIVSDSVSIYEIGFGKHNIKNLERKETTLIRKAYQELEEYFSGKRKQFTLPIKLEGTVFQVKVWNELRNIPYGEVISYKELAERVENKNYARAVGHANNKNPIAIVVPCHRVIGTNKKLIGYAGGLDMKEKLLEIEKL